MTSCNLKGLVPEFFLKVIDQAGTLNIFAFLDNNPTSVLANPIGFCKAPNLMSSPAIPLALNV